MSKGKGDKRVHFHVCYHTVASDIEHKVPTNTSCGRVTTTSDVLTISSTGEKTLSCESDLAGSASESKESAAPVLSATQTISQEVAPSVANSVSASVTVGEKKSTSCMEIPFAKIRLYPKVDDKSNKDTKSFLPPKDGGYKNGTKLHNEIRADHKGYFTLNVKESDSLVSFRAEIVSDKFKKYPSPSANKTTIPSCFENPENIQSLRFEPKELLIYRVKSYLGNVRVLNDAEGYLSLWREETFTVTEDQQISLQAFLLDIEKDNKQAHNRTDNIETAKDTKIKQERADQIVKEKEASLNTAKEARDKSKKAYLNEKKNEKIAKEFQDKNVAYTKANDTYNKKKAEYDAAKNEHEQIKKVLKSNDHVCFLDEAEAEKHSDEVIWAYKLVGKTVHRGRWHSQPPIGEKGKGYHIIMDGDKPKTGRQITLTLQELFKNDSAKLKQLVDNEENIVFFAFPKHYEYDRGEDKEEITPIYCSKSPLGMIGNYLDRVKNIACVELKVIKERYRIIYDGYEIMILENERIIRTFPVSNVFEDKDHIIEGAYTISITYSILCSAIRLNHHVLRYPLYISDGKFKTINFRYNLAQCCCIILKNDTIEIFKELLIRNNIKIIQVKYRKDLLIEITRFRQTLNSTQSKYIISERQPDGSYIQLDVKKATKPEEQQEKLNRIYLDKDYSQLNYCGYILECPGPDTIMGDLELRVPEGIYDTWWHTSGNKSKDKVLKLESHLVSKGRAILIHIGNTPYDTQGCLLPGSSLGTDEVSSSGSRVIEIRSHVQSLSGFSTNNQLPVTVIIRNQF